LYVIEVVFTEISEVVFEIASADSDTDMAALEKLIRDIQATGLNWQPGSQVVPFVFGLQKLIIKAQITNDVSVEEIKDKMDKTGQVGEVEISSFNKIA